MPPTNDPDEPRAADLLPPDDPPADDAPKRIAERRVVGWEMSATLSNDHRIIDGAMAAEYLRTVKEMVENPATVLV